MARILVSISNSIYVNEEYKISCFYEQFISALKQHGNEILVFIPNKFNQNAFCSNNELKSDINEKELRKDIIKFNPELVITFNYATYHRLLECISCPIVIWDADLYPLWNQVEYIKKNVDKFTFFCFSEYGINYAREYFNSDINKMYFVENATNLQKDNRKKKINISFIGTFFGIHKDISEYVVDHSGSLELEKIFDMLRKNPFITKKKILSNFANKKNLVVSKFSLIDEKLYSGFFSSENRINTLNAVCDLGLQVYGDDGWLSIVNFLPSLVSCFHKEQVYTAKQNQDLYNSSKICLNISHQQSIHGIPWRVYDIMATTGCLISSYSSFINQHLKKYIKIPMYHNQFEARDLCIKLLKDDIWRKEIVEASQKYIEKNARWHHRFKQMEEILGIQLINKDKKGNIKILEPQPPLLEKITGCKFNIGIEKVINSHKKQNDSALKKTKKRDFFHFRTKIWPNQRVDIKIKRKTP